MPTRWIDQTQPPQLVNATILLYINAVFAVLALLGGILNPIPLLGIAGAVGIANEKKWGYYLAAGVACLTLLYTLVDVVTYGLKFNYVISLILQVALVYLILNPVSRSYQRIHFR